MNTFSIIPEKTGLAHTIEAECFIVKDYGIHFYNKQPNEVNSLDAPVGYCSTDCVVIKIQKA